MSDIDFDELDRAVNGALGNAPASDPAHSESEPTQEPVIDIPEPAETPEIKHVERTVMDPTTPEKKAPAPSAPATRRSSGRFMDMVHPSSDMRPGTGEIPKEVKPQPAPVVEPISQPSEASKWNEPLESPFLPDAKVEKRPLGGDNAPEVKPFDFQGLLDEPKEELLEAPEEQELLEATSMPDPIDFAAASAVTPEIEEKAIEPEESVKEEQLSIEETPVPQEAPFPIETPTQPQVLEYPQPVVEEPVGPTSITPQYKEQPSSNQESGAIYDTESYHQPVAQPVKKKSSWLTIMWIVILVALGAAAGWAVYTYVLPTL